MGGDVLHNLAELLAAMKVTDTSQLEVLLSENADPDFWVEVESDGSLMVACGVTGLGVSFPTTLDVLWSTATYLEDLYNWRVAREGIAETIEMEEGFAAEVDGPEPEQGEWQWPDRTDSYPFHAPAPGEWTVEGWRRARFRLAYPGFEVTVLRRDGSTASHGDRLADLRDPEEPPNEVEPGTGLGRRTAPGPDDAHDVLVVSIGRVLGKGRGVLEATRGDWLVAPRSAEHVRYMVGVSRGSRVEGVFEVTGFDVVANPGGRARVRFDLQPTALKVAVALPRMFGTLFFDRSIRVFGAVPAQPVADPLGSADEATGKHLAEAAEAVEEWEGAEAVEAAESAESVDAAEEPLDWLRPLLGADNVVVSPSAVATVRARVPGDGSTADPLRSPTDSPEPVTYFAVVDVDDPNRVITFHALTAPEAGTGPGGWWTFIDGAWSRAAAETGAAAGGPLRWVEPSRVPSVIKQLLIVFDRRTRQSARSADSDLRQQLERALRDQVAGSVELGSGYVQWAGYPAGLHLEVGDGRDYVEALDVNLWQRLRWLGWSAPWGDNRNAWFEAEGPDVVEVALDLVTRTLEVLGKAGSLGRPVGAGPSAPVGPATAERTVVSHPRGTLEVMTTQTTNSPAPAPRVIQFPHPGFEYKTKWLGHRSQRSGTMDWKPENSTHCRKYLIADGRVMDSAAGRIERGVRLGFWGEWEAPSRWRRAEGEVEAYHPSVFHEPLLPAERPTGLHQNTDPLVFGERFLYTNCKIHRRAMQDLPVGSIVLFGRGMQVCGEPRFVLDTCFVVDGREEQLEIVRADPTPYGGDLVTDLVLAPLLSGTSKDSYRIRPYVGRKPEQGRHLPFSFFPAVRHDEQPEGFARPVLYPTGALEGLLTETLKMGLKPTTLTDAGHAQAVWAEVVDQVLATGCLLGVLARPPARGSV